MLVPTRRRKLNMYVKIFKKTMYRSATAPTAYRYVRLFLIETLKHSNTILEYNIYIYRV
jgi:hypothetical protein